VVDSDAKCNALDCLGSPAEQFRFRFKHTAFDETASKRGQNYVTVFIDADSKKEPVVFAKSGKAGKTTVKEFKAFLKAHSRKLRTPNGKSTGPRISAR
jgi:hypothetical protein